MKIAITGADRPIGALLCRDLGDEHEVRPIGLSAEPESDLGLTLESYHRADLRVPSSATLSISLLLRPTGTVAAPTFLMVTVSPADGEDGRVTVNAVLA